jgi:curved DNA-binding protein CbpA
MDKDQALRVLGLTTLPTVTQLRRAYRDQVRLWHPDRYSQGSTLRHLAEKNLQDVNLAYAYLKQHVRDRTPKSSPLEKKWPSQPATKWSARLRLRENLTFKGFRKLQRFLPKIDFSQLLKRLPRDGLTPFRPWYRYPKTRATVEKPSNAATFAQALRNAMRPSSGMRRLSRRLSHQGSEDTSEAIAPIARGRRSARPDRP